MREKVEQKGRKQKGKKLKQRANKRLKKVKNIFLRRKGKKRCGSEKGWKKRGNLEKTENKKGGTWLKKVPPTFVFKKEKKGKTIGKTT